jgi:hypothetical protein
LAAALEAASDSEKQTQTGPEEGPEATGSRTIEVCGPEQPHVGEFKGLVRPCHEPTLPPSDLGNVYLFYNVVTNPKPIVATLK